MKNEFIVSLVFLLVAGCSQDTSTNPPLDTGIQLAFSPADVAVTVSESMNVDLEASGLPENVFAISFQVEQSDVGIIRFDSDGSTVGECFGDQAIFFVDEVDNVLYAAVSRVAGDETWRSSGAVLSLQLTGLSPGTSELSFDEAEFVFYDETGAEINNLTVDFGSLVASVTQ